MEANPVEDLPLVVWLRGDEVYFSDFDVDAQEVMHLLNIKRSRLTQISGKELRVGRKRVDRYIRPVYRRKDVEEYQAWLRPTASHQKSSKVLFDAAEQLSQRSEEIHATYQDSADRVLEALSNHSERGVAAVFAGCQDLASKFKMMVQGVKEQGHQAQHQILAALSYFKQEQNHLVQIFEQEQSKNQVVKDLLTSLINTQNYHNQQLLSLQDQLRSQENSKLLDSLKDDISYVKTMVTPVPSLEPLKVKLGERSGRHYLQCTPKRETKPQRFFYRQSSSSSFLSSR